MSKTRATMLALTLLLLPGYAVAQVPALDQGSWLIGGTASFTSEGADDSDDRLTFLNIAPRGQYFVIPALAVGGEVRVTRISDGDNSNTSYAVGPAATYYFVQDGDVHPFVAGSFLYGTSDSDGDTSFTIWQVGGGLLFLLNEAVGIDTRLFYQKQDYDADGFDYGADSYGLSVGIAAFIF